VKQRNDVLLKGAAQEEADATLRGVPLLPSIAVVGCGNKVTVWAFESSGGAGTGGGDKADEDGGVATVLPDGHAEGSAVLGVCVCVAKTAVLGAVRALVVSCGSDEQVLVYDMKTLTLQRALKNGCVASSVAAICVETPPRPTFHDDDDEDDGGEGQAEEKKGGGGGGGGGGPGRGMLQRPAASARDIFAAADRQAAARRPTQHIYIVAGGFDGQVRVWDYDNGRRSPRHAMAGHAGSVLSVAIIPPPPPTAEAVHRAPGVVSGGVDGVMRVWHLERGECLAQVRAHDNHITSVAVSVANGRPLVVTGSRDNKVGFYMLLWMVTSSLVYCCCLIVTYVACHCARSACGTSKPRAPPSAGSMFSFSKYMVKYDTYM